MYRLIFILCFFSSYALYGQHVTSAGNTGDTVRQKGSLRVDQNLRLPSLPNTHALGVLTTNEKGIVILDTLEAASGVSQGILDDSCAAIRADFPSGTGTVTSVATNTGTGITGGTITTSGTIAADTGGVLSTKAYRQKGIDSVNTTVALRVKYTDTSAMLANYLSGMLARVKYTDTASMLLPYQRTVNATSGTVTSVGSGYGTNFSTITSTGSVVIDTIAMATRARVQKGIDSVNGTVALRVKYTDTASMLAPYLRTVNATSGTVTSVATNTGTGITGGTITSSGTIAADTVILATRLRVQKAVDSLNGVIATKGSGTVTSVATSTGTGITGGTITSSGTIAADTFLLDTRAWRQKAVDSLNTVIATKGSGTVTSVATGYGVSGGTITTSGTISADTVAMATRSRVQKAVDSLNITIAAKGSGTVTNVIGGTNISITGTSTIQPTVNITGTIAVANGGTGTTATTSVNATPITYGSDNTITASANTLTTTTLNPTVVNSSLTKVGTITSGTWNGTIGTSATATTASIDDNSTKIATTAYVQLYIPSDTTISAAYTLTSRDLYRTIHCTNGSNIALTVPTGLGTRFTCIVIQEGAGTVTPTTSSTTFYYIPASTTKTKQQGSQMVIRSTATANTFSIQGDLQ